ncbi:ParB/RepB/Spo0J family partition protein [Bifidobacterium commune]|uniref:ParB/RepB/Spo0J family partition protein n=1 Tax=Bifidobacterium commune TaxID=1505727 RepID=UPI003898E6A4
MSGKATSKTKTDGGSAKKSTSKRTNIPRETLSTRTSKRRMMPSLKEGVAHPSDLFFGDAVDEQTKTTAAKNGKTLDVASDKTQENNDGRSAATTKKASNETDESKELRPVQGGYLVELKLDQIGPNVNQPRTIFDEDELKELAESLKEVGILQPIVVRKRPENQKASQNTVPVVDGASKRIQQSMDSEYELIMGERRWRASHLAGLKTIPAIVKTTTDDEMLRDALLENLHRVALNPLEESAAYQQMMEDFGLTQEQLSKSVSKSRSQIANMLRLLNLPASVQKKVAAGVLSAGHARALLGLSDEEEMEKLANRIIAEGLSVRSTEEIVAMKSGSNGEDKKPKSKKNNPWALSPIQKNLEDRFDTKVSIKGNQKHGRIEIVFSSPEDMDRILGLLMPGQQSPSQVEQSENGWV